MPVRHSLSLILFALIASLIHHSETAFAKDLKKVTLNPDSTGFVFAGSEERFVPWGHNYASVDILKRLKEDPARVERDFLEMRDAGTTVVRVHPELPLILTGPASVDPAAIDLLRQLLEIAQMAGIRLKITGLACYDLNERLAWYDELDEEERWKTQAFFWETIAQTCSGHPIVFAYDLINEPASTGGAENGWYMGKLGGYEFCQRLTLTPGKRSNDEIFNAWTQQMISAIRPHDDLTLITIGMLPFPGAYRSAASQLDFVSLHLYPKSDHVKEEIELLKRFDWGKPIVIGETFPLTCSADEEKEFLLKSREFSRGWLGHWPDESPTTLAELKAAGTATIENAIWLSWVDLFKSIGPEMTTETDFQ